jgi:hypothetical protein
LIVKQYAIVGTIKSYRDLSIWQKSVALVTKVYSVTNTFPSTEIYGLTNQMRRCAVSIPSNKPKVTEEIQPVIIKGFYKLLLVLYMSCRHKLRLLLI